LTRRRSQVEAHIAGAVKKGAKVVTGGSFFEPTVLTDVTTDMVITKEETFGPVAPLYRFKSEDEAFKMANDTPTLTLPRLRGREGRGPHLARRLAGQGRRIWMVRRNAVGRSYSCQIVASVHPSSLNSTARSGASAIEKNSSSCGGGTDVPLSIACAWPR
jgi:hypothetical protein